MEPDLLKCVVVGDGTVGKTCLLMTYAKKEYPTKYVPTIFDSYTVSVPIQNEMFKLYLFDTAGQEDYDQLRQLAFPNTDILLVCFSIDYRPSFENVQNLWIPELQKYCPGVPYIIVGTKIDKREEGGRNLISHQQGTNLANELGAVKYLECSALTKENVDDVFQEAILVALSANDDTASSHSIVTKTSSNFVKNTDYNKESNNIKSSTNDGTCKLCSCVQKCVIL